MKTSLCLILILSSLILQAQHGYPDTTFGNGGLVTIFPASPFVQASCVRQSDGKILLSRGIADTIQNPPTGYGFEAFRLNKNGTIDSTYGINGNAQIWKSNLGDVKESALDTSSGALYLGLAITGPSPFGSDFLIAKLDSNGVIDSSFAQDGMFRLDIGNREIPHSIKVQSDGKIVVAGNSILNNNDKRIVAFRIKKNGELDSGFANQGIFELQPFSSCPIRDITISPSGEIFLAGGCKTIVNPWTNSLTVIKMTPNGGLDTAFGFSGFTFLMLPQGESTGGSCITQNSAGHILVGGGRENFNWVPIIAAFDPNSGNLIQTFGDSGIANINPDSLTYFNDFRAIGIQPDGKLIALSSEYVNGKVALAIVRFDSTGSVDSLSFGEKGIVIENFGTNFSFSPEDLFILDNDSFLITGSFSGSSLFEYGSFLSKFTKGQITGLSNARQSLSHKAFPNPTEGAFRIIGNWSKGSPFELEIYRADGMKVYSQSGRSGKGEVKVQDISAVSPGIVFYRLNIDGRSIQGKLVKQ